jgi:Tetratricopeptide repeat
LKSTNTKYLFLAGFFVFLAACSTKKNTFLSRNSHALSTKYNILYNGGISLDKGISDLKLQYKDNFWELLPVERMQVSETTLTSTENKNKDFERAETKATKAIQKHSMNIDGGEKNPQMDEAHLMLGKSRYYDQRFVPALEAFNYVLYKYPQSDKIYEVKIWREKTNMRMDNDALAVANLRKLLKEIKFKDQIFADANATLAQAFLNLKQTDSAIAKIKIAKEFTKQSEEVARYHFILGQIYESQGHKDSAFASYQEVIDMKRKSPRQYVIQAHARQAQQFDYENGDTLAFVKKYNDLLEDRENRPFLDVLNHQMGLFYDKNKNYNKAKKFYNASLKAKSSDEYLMASNYRNLAEINFTTAKYVTAGKYYDSTMVYLNERTREYKLISKKRENLEDVIKFEGIAQRNDSILSVASLSDADREIYYQKYIDILKKEDEKQKILLEKKQRAEQNAAAGRGNDMSTIDAPSKSNKSEAPKPSSPNTPSKPGDFYFYNPATVAFGKAEFVKNWGKRAFGPNWRLASSNDRNTSQEVADNADNTKLDAVDERYSTKFYIGQIPTNQIVLDSLAKDRNFAYYQLGVIYKEKFKEYQRAASKLETLLDNNPEERLVLPSMYNLYKIYEIIDPAKAAAMKNRITTNYPNSRYAQILSNNAVSLELGSPEVVYTNLYKEYESGNYREAFSKTELAIIQFTGDEMLPKFELLKANLVGKLYGLKDYKKALNYVALSYPNSQEGKETEVFISSKIPMLEALYFNDVPALSWKIVFEPKNSLDNKSTKPLLDKLNKFAKERTIETLTVSTDFYTIDRNLIVIHGIKSEENAKGIAQVLKEFKEYKIEDKSIIIATENYKIVQIYKNLEEYIAGVGPTFEPKTKPVIELPKAEVAKPKIEKIKREDVKILDGDAPGGKLDGGRNNQQNSSPIPKSKADAQNAPPSIMPPTPSTAPPRKP